MFALIADGELYFKVDAESDAEFVALNLPKFTYQRGETLAEMSYRLAPESAFRNSDSMRPWFVLGFAAAVRTDEAKPAGKRKRIAP